MRLRARIEAVEQAIRREMNRLEKAAIAPVSEEILTSIHTVLEQLEKEKKRLEGLINRHIDQHPGLKRDQQ